MQLQTQAIMVSTVNELVKQAMLLFILYNDKITDKGSCLDDLMNHFKTIRFSINKSIVSKRRVWIDSTKTPIGSSGMQKLSLQFDFYLHSLIENGFNFDIVKTLDKENHESYMKYNENFELSATAVNERLKFISEDSAKITEVQVEKAKELALKFFRERGFNAGDKDLIYCVKAFCFELFICDSYYKEKGMKSKLLFERMDQLSRNETIYLYSSFGRALFRQNRVLDYYRKFNNVLFRFYILTGKTFYTLSPR